MTTPEFPLLPVGTPLVDIHNTFGAAYIGCLFSIGLLGMTIMQAWFYYGHFPKDPLWMKLVVTGTVLVEFLRSTFTAHAIWYYLVENWGNPLALPTVIWSLSSIVIMTNIGELFGHFYFAWRIFMLTPRGKLRYALTTMVVTFTLWNFGMGIATFVNLTQATNLAEYTQGDQVVLAPFALATAIATDVSIACCLIYVLNRSRTGFSKTNRLINTLIFYAIQVGAITVLADVACIVLNAYVSNVKIQLDYIGVYAFIGNLYANSLLASLNARSALKGDSNEVSYISSMNAGINSSSTRGDDTFFRHGGAASRARDVERNARAVHLQTFVTTTVDTMEDKKSIKGIMRISQEKAGRVSPEDSFIPH